jgi:hypothetical protein
MPADRIKADHPVIVVAWRAVATTGMTEADAELARDWQSVGDLLVWMAGHGDCGGWTFDRQTGLFTCACGDVLYEVGDPVAAVPA